jgi:DNA-binding LytR/AlgR family response regulator
MNQLLKLALLEDSAFLLKDLKNTIEEHHLGEVVLMASNSIDFFRQFEEAVIKPDALILDIDLSGDSMKGTDIANLLDLPVFFITGKTREYVDQIETLRYRKEVPIEFMTKPVATEKLVKLFKRFEKSVIAHKLVPDNLELKVLDGRIGQLKQDKIVFIKSTQNSESNNKEIQLNDDLKTYKVSHTPMKRFFELGLSKEKFIQTSQSYIVNRQYLKTLDITRDKSKYTLPYMVNGVEKTEKIEITDKYWSELNK